MSVKLGIVLSHPVQYYAPLFKFLANTIDLVVLYGHQPNKEEQGRSGFGKAFAWDVDLLKGYDYIFLNNGSKAENFNQFNGISVPYIGKVIKSQKITHVLILGWQYKFYLQALVYCKSHNIPVGVRGDSQAGMQERFIVNLIKNVFYPIFLSSYNRIFYVGKRNKQYLKQFSVPERKLLYSPHAVDQEFWKTTRQANKPVITFVWIGKFVDKKRPLDALKAFVDFKRSTSVNAQLMMVGTGPLQQKCVEAYNDIDSIDFVGFKNQTELLDIYSSASCLLLTSDARETWGLVVNEAFSCGIPAIVSDACGCSPDMINEKSGVIYPLGDIAALSRSMALVCEDLSMNENYYLNGIMEINEKHHFKGSLAAIEAFLRV